MKRYIIPILLFIFVVSVDVFGAGRKSKRDQEVIEREPDLRPRQDLRLNQTADSFSTLGIIPPAHQVEAFDFSVESLSGKIDKLSDYRGKVVFLNFWATWCGPCRMEIKEIDTLYKALHKEDFTVMALSIKEDSKKVSNFMKSYDADFPVYLDSTGVVATAYGIFGIPTTFIIGPDGMIVGRAIGPREWGSAESINFMRNLMDGGS